MAKAVQVVYQYLNLQKMAKAVQVVYQYLNLQKIAIAVQVLFQYLNLQKVSDAVRVVHQYFNHCQYTEVSYYSPVFPTEDSYCSPGSLSIPQSTEE